MKHTLAAIGLLVSTAASGQTLKLTDAGYTADTVVAAQGTSAQLYAALLQYAGKHATTADQSTYTVSTSSWSEVGIVSYGKKPRPCMLWYTTTLSAKDGRVRISYDNFQVQPLSNDLNRYPVGSRAAYETSYYSQGQRGQANTAAIQGFTRDHRASVEAFIKRKTAEPGW